VGKVVDQLPFRPAPTAVSSTAESGKAAFADGQPSRAIGQEKFQITQYPGSFTASPKTTPI